MEDDYLRTIQIRAHISEFDLVHFISEWIDFKNVQLKPLPKLLLLKKRHFKALGVHTLNAYYIFSIKKIVFLLDNILLMT